MTEMGIHGGFRTTQGNKTNTDIILYRKKENYHCIEMNYRLGRSTGAFGAELIYQPIIRYNTPNPPITRTSVLILGRVGVGEIYVITLEVGVEGPMQQL